jgi:hypothetical protein
MLTLGIPAVRATEQALLSSLSSAQRAAFIKTLATIAD